MPHSSIERSRLPEVDALRGIASLMVVWGHAWQWSGFPAKERWYSTIHWATAGVELFFVLSGFLITGILLDHRGHRGYYRNFYMRRVLRILPLFYLVLAVNLVLLHLSGGRLEAYEYLAFLFYASNLLMAWKGFDYSPPLNVTWSLAIEEQFYLAWPAVVRRLGPARLSWAIGGMLVVAALLRMTATGSGWPNRWNYNLTLTRLDGLMLGALIAVWLRGKRADEATVKRLAVGALALGALVFAADVTVLGHLLRWFGLDRSLESGICAAILLTVLAFHRSPLVRRGLANPVLLFFGKISYGMYLYHLLVVMAYTQGFTRELAGVPFLLQLALLLGGATAVAYLSWIFFEEPILRLKRRFEYEG